MWNWDWLVQWLTILTSDHLLETSESLEVHLYRDRSHKEWHFILAPLSWNSANTWHCNMKYNVILVQCCIKCSFNDWMNNSNIHVITCPDIKVCYWSCTHKLWFCRQRVEDVADAYYCTSNFRNKVTSNIKSTGGKKILMLICPVVLILSVQSFHGQLCQVLGTKMTTG